MLLYLIIRIIPYKVIDLGKKGKVTLYLDLEIVQTAKEMSLNVSKTCENALILAIKQLKPIYG